MGKELITAEELDESLRWIDERFEAEGRNIEAEAERERHRKVEIYDDFCHVDTGRRVLTIPQPTLGFLMLYRERRSYFEDDEHGLGRLLVGLRRQKEPGFVRALRMGEDIPDEEADEAMRGVYGEDKVEYYLAVEGAARWADGETEKKTPKLLSQRMGIDLVHTELLLRLSNSPDTLLTKSSTECTSAPSET
jgi:hypothetical protein